MELSAHQDFASCGFVNLKQGCCSLSVLPCLFGIFVCFCSGVSEGNSSITGVMAQAVLLSPVAIFLVQGWRSLVLWLCHGATFWAWQERCVSHFYSWNSCPLLPVQGLLLFIPVYPDTQIYVLMLFIPTLMLLLHVQICSV